MSGGEGTVPVAGQAPPPQDQVPIFDPKAQALFTHKGYIVQKKLGAGAYGTVYKALHTESNMFCAVKVMDLSLMAESFRNKFLPRELQALICCKHENLIQVRDQHRCTISGGGCHPCTICETTQ